MLLLQESGGKLLEAVGNSEEIAAEVIASMKHSMGQEISPEDFANIERFAQQVRIAEHASWTYACRTCCFGVQAAAGDIVAAAAAAYIAGLGVVVVVSYPAIAATASGVVEAARMRPSQQHDITKFLMYLCCVYAFTFRCSTYASSGRRYKSI